MQLESAKQSEQTVQLQVSYGIFYEVFPILENDRPKMFPHTSGLHWHATKHIE